MKPSWNRTKLLRAFITTVLALGVVLVGVRLYGVYRWNVGTKEMRVRLDVSNLFCSKAVGTICLESKTVLVKHAFSLS